MEDEIIYNILINKLISAIFLNISGIQVTIPDSMKHAHLILSTGAIIPTTKRGSHRDSYLEYKGVPKEIDIHNAMFYFMVPLLPDSISKRDRWAYCELVKKGVLYDDALEDIYEKLLEERTDEENDLSSFEEEGMLPFENEDPTAKLPDRNTVKEDFQRYRNLKGKNKNRVEGVAVYMNEKFPTIHEWMLGLLDVMQNRLAWIETDFMSFVCEKLSAENIKFEWLHDAVYVSEENYPKAQ